ncbi:MAG: pyrroline-5-carboxylate reductase dimerization domain-containing protein, partial [Ruminococcus sp.]|nr:pyrroline-5-carboxylate reductase dimerization domain-containing protein [Ruminococcus sp.]
VCSPAGTTIEAVRTLEEGGFRATVMNAVHVAAEKNRNM